MFFLICLSAKSQELMVKEKDGLYGFFEKKTMVVDFQFDSVEQQYDGSFAVRKAGKWGVISRDGREAIPCKYDFIEKYLNDRYIATANGKFGMIDTLGAVLLDFLFDKIDHIEGDTQALVKYQGKWCLYKNGTYVYDDAEFVFNTIDTLPLFPGCQKETVSFEELRNCSNETMYQYIFNHLNYPVEARRKGIQGQVIVQFIVTKDGAIKDPVIRRGLGGGCNEEVLAVVNGMPDWIPAVLDGKKVASRFTLPVKFVLSR
jgi:TonB family protein